MQAQQPGLTNNRQQASRHELCTDSFVLVVVTGIARVADKLVFEKHGGRSALAVRCAPGRAAALRPVRMDHSRSRLAEESCASLVAGYSASSSGHPMVFVLRSFVVEPFQDLPAR